MAAGIIVTRLVSDALSQRRVYLNEMEMKIWLCALCKECFRDD